MTEEDKKRREEFMKMTEEEKIMSLRNEWLDVAKKWLEEDGGFPITFMLLATRDPLTGEVFVEGPSPMLVTDPEESGANNPRHKEGLGRAVRALAIASDALASLFISDTWVVEATKEEEEANPHVPDQLHKDPRRREAISMIVEKRWNREVVMFKQYYHREDKKIIWDETHEDSASLEQHNGRMAVLPRTEPTSVERTEARRIIATALRLEE